MPQSPERNSQDSQELQKLKAFLNELFQFESQDLDFGIYKILNYKRKEIKNFIDNLLTEKVSEQLNLINKAEKEKLEKELDEVAKDKVVNAYIKEKDKKKKETYIDIAKDEIAKYESLKSQLDNVKTDSATEAQIYNHLARFFSRYYDKGDFISKRRYSKNEKYAIPYNGEETYFYWANNDQYYIKSSDFFNKYSFKLDRTDQIVNFKIKDAEEETGNVKSDEKKFFVLAKNPVEIKGSIVNLNFEYRSISESEASRMGKKQDEINNYSIEIIKKFLAKSKDKSITQLFKDIGDEKKTPKLFYELNRYTKRNNYDFFIHKDLSGFLKRELDFYVKNEMFDVDALTSLDSDTHYSDVSLKLKEIKAFKSIADEIIKLLSQIEDFQKKLWEKKKFVINTEYVITLDKLSEYTSKEYTDKIIKEVLKNKEQVKEWKELFGEEILPDWKNINPEDLKDRMYDYKKLPIDTVHFKPEFKWDLLCVLSKENDFDDLLNGLIIDSDNFHGITLLSRKYNEIINCIHIDPPYNTSTSGFLYKNSYQHSSWLSLMKSRIDLSINILSSNGIFQTHIDENEVERLLSLFKITGLTDLGTVIWDKKNPMLGRKGIATQHEYVLWFSKNTDPLYSSSKNAKLMNLKAEEFIKKNGGVNENSRREFANWINNQDFLSGGEKMYKNIDEDGNIYRGVAMGAPEKRTDPKYFIPIEHPETGKDCPVPGNGWSRTPETIKELFKAGNILFGKDESTQPQKKVILNEESKKQVSSVIEDGKSGKSYLDRLGMFFPYCHPVSLYVTLFDAIDYPESIILDFFAGSGTTFHAILELNRDNLNRKCILIENEGYVYSIINPRIKKVAYSFDWGRGKPENMNGLGVFFKYQRLEQYEEALENIAFTKGDVTEQIQADFQDYIPKYFLNFETDESKTFLNIEAMKDPFNYTLRVFDDYKYVDEPVDLIETFNYLIGLYVSKYRIEKSEDSEYYIISGKTREGKGTLVIWRDVSGIDFKKEKKFLEGLIKEYEYEELYINNSAHIEGFEIIENVFKNKMN